jgi:hypothetical protein
MTNLIVARFSDGRIVKGRSLDVAQNRPTCHVRSPDGDMVEVKLKDLKALFFVKSLDGDAKRVDGDDIPEDDPRLRGAHLVEIKFRDGERIVGLAMRYPPTQPFFFLVPVDHTGNNLRILVNHSEVETMQAVTANA